jgi:hypothetical protein
MRDVIVGLIELWVWVYLLGVAIGFGEMAWFAWRTRGQESMTGDGWFWRQYLAVIAGWPLLLGWWVRAVWRDRRERRR